jgi:hypothetical protein
MIRTLRPDQLADDVRKQMERLLGSTSQKELNRKVIGPVMVTGVILRFQTGKGPDGAEWKSGAATTKLGGKFSERYDTRPSGRKVTASSIRNLDTGALANAHTVIEADAQHVKVGPGVRGKAGKARKVMEREATYGNNAVGWDDALVKVVNAEIQAFMDEIAAGRKPRYLPRSKVTVRV